MDNEQKTEPAQSGEIVPTDMPESEMMQVIADESPEVTLARLEKAAELAPRWRSAMRTLLMSLTFPGDWEIFGENERAKVCLSSAGAERVATQFNVKFFDVAFVKKQFTDEIGEGYRYTYTGKATLGGRIIFTQGVYSTRDPFLGKAAGEFKPLIAINENDIQTAAYHRFLGNGIKSLLGLRAMPVDQYRELMDRSGQDAKKTTAHKYAGGAKGGTDQSDKAKQGELAAICIRIAQAGFEVEFDLKTGGPVLNELDDTTKNIGDPMMVAEESCKQLSAFVGKNDKLVAGKGAKHLTGKRLEISLDKARKAEQDMQKRLSSSTSSA